MLPVHISNFIISCIASMASTSAMQFLETVLLNSRAMAFATETLRDKYEAILMPASYDHVVSNLMLRKQDFIDYIKEHRKFTQSGLEDFLKQKIADRSADWTLNRPEEITFNEILEDFYAAYFRFFVTNNEQLSLLNVTAISQEVLQRVSELIKLIQESMGQFQVESFGEENFGKDLLTFLTSLCIPHTVIQSSKACLATVIYEPSTLFPSRNLLVYYKRVRNPDDLDAVADLGRTEGTSSVILASEDPMPGDIERYAASRRIRTISVFDLKQLLLRQQGNVGYIMGNIGAQEFARRLNTHEVYIPPDAVLALPGDEMERKYLSERNSALALIDEFLARDEEKLLFVLGGYGTGKSALCCNLLMTYSGPESQWSPVYIPLKDIPEPRRLAEAAERGFRLGKAVGGVRKKVLLILDGLDELSNAMSRNGQRENMLSIHLIASRYPKVIVTVRASYFRGMDDFWAFFSHGQEGELWDRVSRFIPESQQRPRVSAIVLREFNNAQIEEYVTRFGAVRNKDRDYKDEFFASLHNLDHAHLGRILARNPLYLFLLTNTEPWNLPQVKCFADVLSVFADYWLARDIEKGPSRWLLTLHDRKLFISEIAWEMFTSGKHMLTHAEFEDYVRKYFLHSAEQEEMSSLTLDLQTTGIFYSIGETLIFSFEAFADLFVAQRFYQYHPIRIPSVDQVNLLLGMIETAQKDFVYHPSLPSEELDAALRAASLSRNGKQISIDSTGIIYGKLPEGWNWPRTNREKNGILRSIVNRAYELAEEKESGIRLRISGRLGLHARASAWFVVTCSKWLAGHPAVDSPSIRIECRGREVNAGSIMGVMMLAATKGSMITLNFQNCQRRDVENFLRVLGAQPVEEKYVEWDWDCQPSRSFTEH